MSKINIAEQKVGIAKDSNLKIALGFILLILICIIVAFVLFFNVHSNNKTAETTAEEISSAEKQPTVEAEALAIKYYEEIDNYIKSVSEKNGAVGVQVAVVENGNITGGFSYGWAVKDKTAMTPEHKVRVASITKILVGIAAMLLIEDGVIDPDASIGEIWETDVINPYYPDAPVTIRNMLNHTSSIIAYGDEYSMSYDNVLKRFKNCYSNLKPGAFDSWCYNNYVFRVLGMTLEIAAGRKLDDILHERVYSVLDIDAAFAAGDVVNTDMLAALYAENNSVERSVTALKTFHVSSEIGGNGAYYAGGLTISSADLAKIVVMLYNDGIYNGKQILTRESVEFMETCFDTPLEDGSYQGTPLLYMPDIYGREGIFFHTGSAYGSFNCISYDPLTGDGVVVLTTGAADLAETADIRYICDDINEFIYTIIA